MGDTTKPPLSATGWFHWNNETMILTLMPILIMHGMSFPSKEVCLINWVPNVIYRSLAAGRSPVIQSHPQATLLLLGDYDKMPVQTG